MEIRRLEPGDDTLLMEAGNLFDHAPLQEAVSRFLSDPNHHLILAIESGKPVGFVSGVEMTHPDKGTEMFLYELAVDEDHRRRGIGTALVTELRNLAQQRGCYDMWVLTDEDNEPALKTYQNAGSSESSAHVMLTWRLG